MTIRIFQTDWSNIAQKINVFKSTWVEAKKVVAWRGSDTTGIWSVIYPDSPVAIVGSSVTGNPKVGATIGLTNNDVWGSTEAAYYYRKPDTITYQWQKSLNNSTWSDITNATSSTYVVQSSDINYYLRCRITAQNEKTIETNSPVTYTTSNNFQISDPYYAFAFGQDFGVNPNGFIMFDRNSNGVFPNSESYLIDSNGSFINSRMLGFFMGDYRFYSLSYKSDSTYFRLWIRLYNQSVGSTPPTLPPLEYEIVFNNITGVRPETREFADIYIANETGTGNISNYFAYLANTGTTYQIYSNLGYYTGAKITVPMNSLSSISYATARPSNSVLISSASVSGGIATINTSEPHNLFTGNPVTIYGFTGSYSILNGTRSVVSVSPGTNSTTFTINTNSSTLNLGLTAAPQGSWSSYPPTAFYNQGGWISLGDFNNSGSQTVTFTAGVSSSSDIGSVQAFNKSDMFMPNGVTNITTSNQTTNSVTVSWANANPSHPHLNAKSYRVQLQRVSDSIILSTQSAVTTTSTVINGLTTGTGYNIIVTPNSRSDGLGQFYFPTGLTYNHALTPNAPISLAATVNSDTQITLTWTEPANNGSTITGYTVQYKKNADSTWTTWATNAETDRSAPITGLTGSTLYNFRVAAVNGIGTGGWANVNATTNAPAVPPGAPTNLVASSPSQASAGGLVSWTVSWTPPTNNGGAAITKYQYAVDIDASGTTYTWGAWNDVAVTNGVPNTSVTVTVFSGIQLSVKVRAVNSAGGGTESTALTLATSPSKPGTPSAGAITNNNTNVQSTSTINWTASNINGGTSLRYRIYRGGNTNNVNTERNTSVNGESNTSFSDIISGSGTTYYYRVVPENVLQTSPNTVKAIGVSSEISSVLNVTQPSVNRPTLSINNTNAGIDVNWTGSAGSGTTPSYRVFRSQNTIGFSDVGTGNLRTGPISNTNFTDTASASTTYYYRIDAINSINTVASPISLAVTTPGSPTANTPVRNNANSNLTNRVLAVNWSGSGSGTIRYDVYRSQNTANNPNTLVSPSGGQTATNFSFQYASGQGPFYFRVVPSSVWGTGSTTAWSAGLR